MVLSGKEINVKEGGFIGKFGGQETYESVKKVMESALEGWKGKEEELGGKAFHMYEKFRPTVPKGEQGWGRKGELNLAEVKNVAKRVISVRRTASSLVLVQIWNERQL